MRNPTATLKLAVLKERKQLLDDVWLLTIFCALAAIGVPWFLRLLDVDFAPVAWTSFGYGCLYFAVSQAVDRTAHRQTFLTLLLALHSAGILTLGVLWSFSGSWRNPAFLSVFLLPVLAGAVVFNKWRTFGMVGLTLATVAFVTLTSSPGLQWYVTQWGLPNGLFSGLLTLSPASARAFPGLTEVPSYLVVLLFGFVLLAIAMAIVGDSVRSLVDRMYGRLSENAGARERSEGLAGELVRLAPIPSVLLYADTYRISQASDSFLRQFFIDPDALADQTLFTAVAFAFPDVVQDLIAGPGGEIPLVVCEVRGERRLTRARVSKVSSNGTNYALLSLEEVAESQYLRVAVNALAQPLLIVDPGGRIMSFNRAASEVFEQLDSGTLASSVLRAANLPFEWWELGSRARSERPVQLLGRSFVAHCSATRLEGQREPVTVVRLQPMESTA